MNAIAHSRSRPYSTQPGTVAHRVVEHLRGQVGGFEMASAEICDLFDIDGAGLSAFLSAARQHGVLIATERVRNGRKTLFWRLGDGTPLPRVQPKDPPLNTTSEPLVIKPGPFFPAPPEPKKDPVDDIVDRVIARLAQRLGVAIGGSA